MKQSWNVNCLPTSMQSEQSEKKLHPLRKYLKPIIASMIASIGSMVVGTIFSYPSPAIPNINAHPNPFRINPEESSWVGSLVFLSGIPGALYSGWVIDRFGRKLSFLMTSIPFVFGFVVIVASRNVYMMYVGRLLSGFCFALMICTVGAYISEIAPAEIRGHLMSFHELSINIGVLLIYVLGTFLPWNWLAIVCASISCVHVLLVLFIPETPRWLIFRGHKEEAIKSLCWLHDNQVNAEEEVKAIQQSITKIGEPLPLKDYFKPPLLKSLIISQSLFILQEFSGVNVVRFYTVSIFQSSGTHLDPNMQSIIIGTVMVVGSIVATAIIDHFERRKLLIFSNIVMGLSMAAMGAFFKLKETDPDLAQNDLYWLPLLSLISVTIGFVLGYGPLPIVVTNELFPTQARGRGSSFGVTMLCISGFLITKLFINLSDVLGEAGAFWLCAGISFAGSVLVFFLVPNTMGKTLENIQQNIEH